MMNKLYLIGLMVVCVIALVNASVDKQEVKKRAITEWRFKRLNQDIPLENFDVYLQFVHKNAEPNEKQGYKLKMSPNVVFNSYENSNEK